MNILSMFDGISCGRVALARLAFDVHNYFASEVDRPAIALVQERYPDTIQLGSAMRVSDWELPKIYLLLGGSPCQGFSTSGKYLNWDDPRSTLFFRYVDALRKYKPTMFLYENVIVHDDVRDAISLELGVDPIRIDSALVSAQSRERYYWTNIPNVTQPEDRGIVLDDILDKESGAYHYVPEEMTGSFSQFSRQGLITVAYSRIRGFTRMKDKAYPIQASDYKAGTALNRNQDQTAVVDLHKLTYRGLNFLERERLQTLPEGYTAGMVNTPRYKALGNAWTIDVIAHILSNLGE